MKLKIITLIGGILIFVCGLYFQFSADRALNSDLGDKLAKRYVTYAGSAKLLMILGGVLVIMVIISLIVQKTEVNKGKKH